LQRDEITELTIYHKIIPLVKSASNRQILERFAQQERKHCTILKNITTQEVAPLQRKVWFYYIITRLFGLNFGLKLLERDETQIIKFYDSLKDEYPEINAILQDEEEHERELLNLMKSPALDYASSIILGLNDALIELTGALIGFTLALAATHMVAIVGLITGCAASLSMASASYLSAREDGHKKPLTSGIITGASYITTTILLIAPYVVISNAYIALICTLIMVIAIIAVFNFYAAVSKNVSFKKRFVEMLAISVIVGAINFGIGILIKRFFPL
jgi:VIT1/CCC1 family predicted Fe2+/Mn2+ transporter